MNEELARKQIESLVHLKNALGVFGGLWASADGNKVADESLITGVYRAIREHPDRADAIICLCAILMSELDLAQAQLGESFQ